MVDLLEAFGLVLSIIVITSILGVIFCGLASLRIR